MVVDGKVMMCRKETTSRCRFQRQEISEDFDNNYMRIGHESFLIRAKCGHECTRRYHDFKDSPSKTCDECFRYQKYNNNLSYEEIAKRFEDVGCKLLTTKDEYVEKKMTTYSELVFKTFCDHERTIRLSQSKLTENMLCKECLYENQSIIRKETAKKDGLTVALFQEYESICYLKNILEESFHFEILDECCKADIGIKPKDVDDDLWIGMQVKSTSSSQDDKKYKYNFATHKNDYSGLLVICVCVKDKKIWSVDPDIIKGLDGFQVIEKPGTKYFNYKVRNSDLSNVIFSAYNNLEKQPFDVINKPLVATSQQEQEFKKNRINKINFLNFEKPYMNCLVYDFKINGKKVQEKVASKEYVIHLHKSNGVGKKQPYEQGDNDFYWINLQDKKYFYIIPESVLIENGYIKSTDTDGKTKLSLQPKPYFANGHKNQWVNQYMYNYENLDKESIISLFRV